MGYPGCFSVQELYQSAIYVGENVVHSVVTPACAPSGKPPALGEATLSHGENVMRGAGGGGGAAELPLYKVDCIARRMYVYGSIEMAWGEGWVKRNCSIFFSLQRVSERGVSTTSLFGFYFRTTIRGIR